MGGTGLPLEGKLRVLTMVESARRGRRMYKPTLARESPEEDVARAYDLYLAWARTESPWREMQKVDPLANTDIKWVEP